MKKEHYILVVDDEEDSLEMMGNILRANGCNVILCQSGSEALKKLEKTTVDLIIADLVMAGINGIELLREIRKRGINSKFIMVTAYGEMESYIEVMNLGAVEYLSKPINHSQLLQIITNSLGNCRAAEK